MTTLTLVRGLPGSGKSTLAQKLRVAYGTQTTDHFEADQFFTKDGVYKWDGMQIGEAHAWCQNSTDDALFYKRDVIVSNTFTTIKELRPYFAIAKDAKANLNVIVCQRNFGTIHDVPEKSLEAMKNRFVWDISSLFLEYEL